MTRRVLALVQLPVLLTAVLVVLLAWLPGRRELVLHVYSLLLAGYGLAVLVGAIRRSAPLPRASAFDAGLRRRRPAGGSLPELERFERDVQLARTTAFDVHLRLRPHVRRVAAHLLAARGVDLDADPDRARRLLGEQAWELARPDRPAPSDRHGPGLPERELENVLTALERLA